MNKVSLIIPVYNVGGVFLEKCLKSAVTQDYTNLEVVIVDDGSTDNSLGICEKIAKENKNVKLLIQENRGVSAARNNGIDHASGDFCCFVDSDDYIEPNYISKMVAFMSQPNIDLVCCGCYRENLDGSILWERKRDKLSYYDNKSTIINLYSSDGFCGWPWNKLFRMSIINDYHIRFPKDIKYCEDEVFCMNYILHIHKSCYIPDILYHYMVNDNSVNLQMINKKVFNYQSLDRLRADEIMLNVINKHYTNDVVKILKARIFLSTIMTMNKFIACYNNDKATLNVLRRKLVKYLPYYLLSKYHKKTVKGLFSNLLLCIYPLYKV